MGCLLILRFRLHVRIEFVHPLGVPRQRLGRHWTVHKHRHDWNALLLFESPNPVDQLLYATDCECRNDEFPASVHRFVHDARQLLAIVVLLVNAIPVRGLHEEVIGLVHQRRIRKYRTPEPPKIPAKENRGAAVANSHVCRAEEMAGIDEVDFNSWRDGHRPLVADRLKKRNCAKRICFGVERQGGFVLRIAMLVRVRRVFLLNPPRVGQHDPAQVARARRAVHPSSESISDQSRQVPAVIQVSVRQDDGLELGGVEREILPVALPEFLQALKQPAIDQDFRRARVE